MSRKIEIDQYADLGDLGQREIHYCFTVDPIGTNAFDASLVTARCPDLGYLDVSELLCVSIVEDLKQQAIDLHCDAARAARQYMGRMVAERQFHAVV